ncbi:MAG TPA: DUF2231 domain-containing protein [Thermoanaerobaculia bacterium]|nr:DUF2231 domain-containing protein [Thermoanaerobaculia bacterium]
MKARARILGHPLHRVLIVFPLGLLATSFFFDLAWLARGREQLALVAWWLIFAGVVGGFAAAIFGLVDWLAIPQGTRARRVGALHGGGMGIVALLYAASWLLRRDAPADPEAVAILLSGLGVLLTVITGWLGGELANQMEEMET